MAINKNYCMSSYMAFRYIEKDDIDFYNEIHHKNIIPIPDKDKVSVHTADDIDVAIEKQIEKFANVKKGILLSGGMDSAIVASYIRGGTPIHSDSLTVNTKKRN